MVRILLKEEIKARFIRIPSSSLGVVAPSALRPFELTPRSTLITNLHHMLSRPGCGFKFEKNPAFLGSVAGSAL